MEPGQGEAEGLRGHWAGNAVMGRPGSPQEAHLRDIQEQMAKK